MALSVAKLAEKCPGTSTRLLWVNIEEEEGVEDYLMVYRKKASRKKTKVAMYVFVLRLT